MSENRWQQPGILKESYRSVNLIPEEYRIGEIKECFPS